MAWKGQTQVRRRGSRSNVGGQYTFAQIPNVQLPRSTFNRSSGLKTTLDSGFLTPIFTDEVLPGDTIDMSMTAFVRMSTPLRPVIDNLCMQVYFFYCPNRILWSRWKEFMGEQLDPDEAPDETLKPPTVAPSALGQSNGNNLWDAFGLPMGTAASLEPVNAFHHRAYVKCFNEWFRDQNLVSRVPERYEEPEDAASDYVFTQTSPNGENEFLLRAGKKHDFLTSALPFAQKGPPVLLPLGDFAPVIPVAENVSPRFSNSDQVTPGELLSENAGDIDGDNLAISNEFAGNEQPLYWFTGGWDDSSDTPVDGTGSGLKADLGAATSSTINLIREAFQIQRLYERDARGGTRYTELLRSHFLVSSPDGRQQRPEYLGGGKFYLQVNPVPNTAGTDSPGGPNPSQGDLAAFVNGANTFPNFTKSFTEHGVILGLAVIRADLNYQQRLDKMWRRGQLEEGMGRFDYYWPALSRLGEQVVRNDEAWFYGGTDEDAIEANKDVWGYQERWAEMRYKPSMITGAMRSPTYQVDPSASIGNVWHLAQEWGDDQDGDNRPLLNERFISENPPVKRILAVQDEPEFILDAFFSYRHTRPMPTYSVPGMVDHF